MRTLSKDQIRDVAESVLTDAAQRGLSAGSQLPTERALADSLELSRSTVRSALSLLETEQVVSREVGRGTYLKYDPLPAMINLDSDEATSVAMLNDIGPGDVMAARQAFEPMAMYVAVVEATESDFEEIARWVKPHAKTQTATTNSRSQISRSIEASLKRRTTLSCCACTG